MKKEPFIRVAVASDQDIYRRGLVSLITSLSPTRLVGEARDETEALQLCEMLEPDILLLDIKNLPEGGREIVHAIHQRWPGIKVVFLLNSSEENQDTDEPADGEMIYFSKDISEDEFSKALQDIHRNLRPTPQPATRPGPSPAPQPELVPAAVSVSSRPKETSDEGRIRELKMAGRIQADILPESVPAISGWDISARLLSARETSGDFFDFIPLDDQHWGIVVGDVTDKSIGAALFMALTSTLIRTYAVRYPTLPALAMDVVNQRMLSDTRGNIFVTAFYGVLEQKLGRLRFVNAGHPPALLVGSRGAKPIDQLKPTGVALGMLEKTHWRQKVVKFQPGDILFLYTDGITEAQNPNGDFYGIQRLMRVLRASAGQPAKAILDRVLLDVRGFVGNAPQHDDIAAITICRK